MALTPQDGLVVLQISSRRVAITVAWREEGVERVVSHRAIECLWHDLDDHGRRQALQDILRLGADSAGIDIYSVYVSLADPSLRANFATGYADLGQAMMMTLAERNMALIRATHQAIGTDREVLHALPQRWEVRSLEGDREVEDPIGQIGSRLTCHVLLVTADRSAHEHIEAMLHEFGVNVEGIIAQPVGLYRGLSSHLTRRGSTLVIDCGARHTNILVHRKSRLVHVETHAFGGDHLTQAVVADLQVPFDQAERIKRGLDISEQDRSDEVEGQTYLWREVQERQRQSVPAVRICNEVLKRFFGERAKQLRDMELLAQRGRIHLVGRASALQGLPQLIKEVFKHEVVLGTSKADREASTEMADLLTVGLVRQAAIERERRLAERNASGIRHMTSAATGLFSWLFEPLR